MFSGRMRYAPTLAVCGLTYLNTEHLGISETDRKAVFDVYCENEKGEKILVETTITKKA